VDDDETKSFAPVVGWYVLGSFGSISDPLSVEFPPLRMRRLGTDAFGFVSQASPP
jgi:hypothetical protein